MLKKVPHTYVIVFSIIVIAAILTCIIPGGEFERQTININGIDREIIVEGSFHYLDNQPQTWQVFSSIFEGFVDKADIVVFILIIGGAFWIMNDSKAIDVGILSFLRFTKRLQKYKLIRLLDIDNIIITLIMLVFSVFGATFGMCEETIAFIIIFVPLSIRMGYDSIVGVSMCYIGAGLGFAGALLNPFTIGIAQGISNLPLFSGIEYRFFCWIIINIVGIGFVLRYVKKLRKNPKRSPVFEDDKYWRDKESEENSNITYHTPKMAWITFLIVSIILGVFSFRYPISTLSLGNNSGNIPIIPILSGLFVISGILTLRKSAHFFVLNLLAFTILILIVGVLGYDWYIMEIATLFLFMGLIAGMTMNRSASNITKLFIEGVKDIIPAAMVVGIAGGILIVMQNGKIIDTLLYYVAQSMEGFNHFASVGMMYFFQTLINIFIPSGSAKAALTMPIMSQFSDLIGVSRQATVMAYQLGDGFTNMITPTSPVLIGVLGVARIAYDKWVKWITPLMIVLILLGLALLIPTVFMNLNGF
ncbi:MAG: AbgT family transporter [Bacteroidales bacterium]|nr:AbgT family transporter [Bacteroidales bacterium]